MAKVKSTITGFPNRLIHRSEVPMLSRDGLEVRLPSNHRALDMVVESGSVRTTDHYDWKTGKMEKRKMDLLENARRHINSMKIYPVTNARHRESGTDSSMNGCCAPSWGNVPSPPSGKRK